MLRLAGTHCSLVLVHSRLKVSAVNGSYQHQSLTIVLTLLVPFDRCSPATGLSWKTCLNDCRVLRQVAPIASLVVARSQGGD